MTTHAITSLNDEFRSSLVGGRVLLTQGVDALGTDEKTRLLTAVMTYTAFSGDNDPWGEHDFGSIDQDGTRYFWKIDYYDPCGENGSEDPADPAKTLRVLTIMRADEY